MSTRTVRLTESRPIGDGFRLDKEAGIAYGVAVCGGTSLNGRDYPDDVRDRDKAVYEGVDCFIDHDDGKSNRRVREWFGKIRNPRTRVSDKKTIGDLHYPTKSNFTEEFIERCERFPNSFALSHVASCKSKRIGGRDKIESISKVHSVDLVIGAATNASIYESIQHPGTPMKISEYIASGLVKFADSKGFKVLKEMDMAPMDMPADAPPMDAAADDADPVKAAFIAAMKGLIDQYDNGDLDDVAVLKKFKDVLKAHVKLACKDMPACVGDGKDPETPAEDAAESLRKTKAKLTVEIHALRNGVTLTPLQEKAALGFSNADDCKAFIESLKPVVPAPKGKAESGAKEPATAPAATAPANLPPTDGKKFAESLRR